jgi:hypothetical protein
MNTQSGTIGAVPRGPANTYWEFALSNKGSKFKAPLAYLFWLVRTCLIFLYSLMLYVGLKVRYGRSHISSDLEQQAIDYLPLFVDVYPTSVYPLVVKSMELACYVQQKLQEPSLEIATGDGFFTNRLCTIKHNNVTIASDLIGYTNMSSGGSRLYWIRCRYPFQTTVYQP